MLKERALVHRSWSREHGGEDNERLEFLGDRVLGLLVAEMLLERLPDADEGELSRTLQALVRNEAVLAGLPRSRALARRARLGRGEEATGGRARPRLLAGLYEAHLGAVYLEDGLDAARAVVRSDIGPMVADAGRLRALLHNPKDELQRWAQRRLGTIPEYEDLGGEGPDHRRVWRQAVRVDGEVVGTGEGRTKQQAQERAAEAALEALGVERE